MSEHPEPSRLRPLLDAEPLSASPLENERLPRAVAALIGADMEITAVTVPRRPQAEGAWAVYGRLRGASHEIFGRWLQGLNQLGYTPFLRADPAGRPKQDVVLRLMAGVVPKSRGRVWPNLLLFMLTVLSTLFVGSAYAAAEGQSPANPLTLAGLARGLPFSLTLLGILAAHEFGHYFAARYHRVSVSLPYFIPMPLFLLGTLGAFIRLREPIPDRRKLFDIGVAGPLAGLALALPLLFYGLSTSPVKLMEPMEGSFLEGNSLLYYGAKLWIFGRPLPNFSTGEDVFINQVAMAAWAGLLVTGLNLLPVGQLDGGHTVFALFGSRARVINQVTLGLMLLLAVAGLDPAQRLFPALIAVGYSGWFLWAGLLIFMIGPYHPPALDDVTELDGRRRLLGYLVILVFVLTFVPVPIRFLG